MKKRMDDSVPNSMKFCTKKMFAPSHVPFNFQVLSTMHSFALIINCLSCRSQTALSIALFNARFAFKEVKNLDFVSCYQQFYGDSASAFVNDAVIYRYESNVDL